MTGTKRSAPVVLGFVPFLLGSLCEGEGEKDPESDADVTVVVEAVPDKIALGETAEVTATFEFHDVGPLPFSYSWASEPRNLPGLSLKEYDAETDPFTATTQVTPDVVGTVEVSISFFFLDVDRSGEVTPAEITVEQDPFCGVGDQGVTLSSVTPQAAPPGTPIQLAVQGFPPGFTAFQTKLGGGDGPPYDHTLDAKLLTAPNDLSVLNVEVPTGPVDDGELAQTAEAIFGFHETWEVFVEYCGRGERQTTNALPLEVNYIFSIDGIEPAEPSAMVGESLDISVIYSGNPVPPLNVSISAATGGTPNQQDFDDPASPIVFANAVDCYAAGDYNYEVRMADSTGNVPEPFPFVVTCQ